MPEKATDKPASNDMQAMTRVLDAEAEAARRIDAARAEAREIGARAQAEARAITERADRRVQRLHATSADRMARRKLALADAFEAGLQEADQPVPEDRITAAVATLARKLIGGSG